MTLALGGKGKPRMGGADGRGVKWQSQANCKGQTDEFFQIPDRVTKDAADMCDNCPVFAECWEHAVLIDRSVGGVWAKTTEADRRRIRRKLRAGAAVVTLDPTK